MANRFPLVVDSSNQNIKELPDGDSLLLGDSEKLLLGDGTDLQIYHDGSNSFIDDAGTGNLQIRGTQVKLQKYTGENMFVGISDGAASMYYDNSQKIATTSTGIDVTGTATMDGLTVNDSGVLRLNDDATTDFFTIQQGGTQVVLTADSPDGAANMLFKTAAAGVDKNRLNIASNGDISFYEDTGTTAKLFWDASAESLGIGTTSPTLTGFGSGTNGLEIADATQAGIRLNGDAADSMYFVSGSGKHWLYGKGAVPMTFSTNGSEAMRIDSSGNVGIGAVPESWYTTIDALQVGLGASFAGSTANPSRTYLSANYYKNSSNQETYLATDEASQYFQNAGTHIFKVAPSGTADSAISWTTAMTIDNSGNVTINSGQLTAGGLAYPTSDGTNGQVLTTNGSGTLSFSTVSGTTINNNADNRIITGSGTANTLNGESGLTYDGSTLAVTGAITSDSTVTSLTNFNSTSGNDLRLNAGSANRDIFMQVNGTTHMTVQGSTGNVGIATTGPGGILDIKKSYSGNTLLSRLWNSEDSNAASNAEFRIVSGNAATPILTFGDSSAVRHSISVDSSDNVLFKHTGSTERMRIQPDGTTTIGRQITTTYNNTNGYALHIQGASGTQTYLAISVPGANSGDTGVVIGHDGGGTRIINREADPIIFHTNNTETMRLTSAGKLGIGTSSPAAVLHISKDVGNTELEALRLSNFDPDQPNNQFGHAVSLSFELPANDGGNTDGKLAAKIVGLTGANLTNDWYTNSASTNFQGQLDFYTRKDDVLTNQMTLNEDGFLGIGTTNPSTELHVYSADQNALTVQTNTGINQIGILNSTNSPTYIAAASYVLQLKADDNGWGGTASAIQFNVKSTERMKIAHDGETTISGTKMNVVSSAEAVMGAQATGNSYWRVVADNSPNTYFQAGTGQTSSQVKMYFTGMFGSNNTMTVDTPNSRVGIGTTGPGTKLDVAGGDIRCQAANNHISLSYDLPGYGANSYGNLKSSANYIYFSVGSSYVANINSSGTYSVSDLRLKENITDLTGSLDKILQLRGVNFTWKDTEIRGSDNHIGFIAQEVEEIVPELVNDGGLPVDEDGNEPYKTVNYAHLVPVLVEAIKELKAELDAAKARITELEG